MASEPRCEKTGLRSFRSCPTQTGLYSHRRWLEATEEVEGLYYPFSENKGADQLSGYREAVSLFSHMLKAGFLMARLILNFFFQIRKADLVQ